MDLPAAFARLCPRPEERVALVNLLGLLALPLLAYLVFLGVNADRYALELPVQTDHATRLLLELDRGAAGRQILVQPVPATVAPWTARFEFPAGPIAGLRLHLGHGAGVLRVGAADLRSQGDEILGLDRLTATFGAERFHPADGIRRWSPLSGEAGVQVERDPAAVDAVCTLDPPQGPALGFNAGAFAGGSLLAVLLAAGLVVAGLSAWRRLLRVERFRRRAAYSRAALERGYAATARFVHARPGAAIWLAALAGVLLSCYPVVFFGRSFMSPNLGSAMLYDRYPTLPGGPPATHGSAQGSDISAILWAFAPYAAIQRQALFVDHELPFHNRYGSGGVPLLGQGQSMLGDPLQWIVLLGGADAGAWDLKFLLAKLLFAAGVGWTVRTATRHQPSALLLAFASCFLGFFTYRFNHPAFFSVCYAPWILYAWLEIARRGASPRWLGLLLLANWCEMNSGTVKEAYMLLLSLNAGGVLILAFSDALTWRRKGIALAVLAWLGACFALVAAPVLWTLFDTLAHSWSEYDSPTAWQLQPGLFAGLFDDIFYRQFTAEENTLDPSANFVVLLGAALAVGAWKGLARRERTFLPAVLGGAAAAALAFGVVPPGVIKAVPFLGNVSHCDNTFSNVLILFLFIVAGHGLASMWRRFEARAWTLDVAAAAAVLAVLVGAFLGLTQAAQRSAVSFLPLDAEIPKSGFFWMDVAALSAAFLALPFLLRRFCRDRGASALGVAPWLVLALGAMLWRQGNHLPLVRGMDRYTTEPTARASFYGRSDAVEFLRAQTRVEPGRVQGIGDNLVPGTGGLFGLETPSGPDALQNRFYHPLLAAGPMIWKWRLVLERDRAGTPGLQQFFDLLNVRYFVDRPGHPDVPGWRRVGRFDLDVFESETAWPRAFFTDGLATCRDETEFLARAVHGDGRPFAAVGPEVLAARPDLAALAAHAGAEAGRQVVRASDYRLTSNTTTFRVRAPGPGVIALLEGYEDASVEAMVNGRPAPHFRLNTAFAGVSVDRAGDYMVSFRHRPRGWAAALGACALGLALLAGTAWFAGGRKFNAETQRTRSPEEKKEEKVEEAEVHAALPPLAFPPPVSASSAPLR